MAKSKIIIFDFEVFKYDVLLGALIIENSNKTYCQLWNIDDIKNFYKENINNLWVGHNNEAYDNLILESIINDKNPYNTSVSIINSNKKPKCSIKLNNIDLMKIVGEPYSLKMTEGAFGNDISETEVNFNLDRPLNDEEKLLTENYNKDDLNQTYKNFTILYGEIETRFDLISEFNLGLSNLNKTKTQLGAKCLKAKKINGIENMIEKPRTYQDLKLNNKELLNYYFNEKYLTDERIFVNVCNGSIKCGSGGCHQAQLKYYAKEGLYFDVSGFYNLTMINRDLLPRTLDDNARNEYIRLYKLQLELKKKDPRKRAVYKTILLGVFGGMLLEYTDFYDPYRGNLVMITGQLYLIDLLEKLNGKVELIQTNTDGIIVKLINKTTNEEVISIVEEWENRTGYTIKKVPIYDIWQRDVNCYMYRANNKIVVVGENAVYDNWQDVFSRNMWKVNEPPIIAHCVVEYLMNNISPEDTIEKYKNELRMFQYIKKKDSYDYIILQKEYDNGMVTEEKIQNVNRFFASKYLGYSCIPYKVKSSKGVTKRTKISYLPSNVILYNKNINEGNLDDLKSKIDYDYYVLRAYEKIATFMPSSI